MSRSINNLSISEWTLDNERMCLLKLGKHPGHYKTHRPAEKGMNAFLFIQEVSGLKVCRLSHSLSSARTDVSKGQTAVPCEHRCDAQQTGDTRTVDKTLTS